MVNSCEKTYTVGKYALERAKARFSTLYAVFWVWARGEGYDVAMGAMKEAWQKYAETEMPEQDKVLFEGEFGVDIRNEFNKFCAEKLAQERENRKEEIKNDKRDETKTAKH